MKESPKPIRRAGFRNIACPIYGKCLDAAVKKLWQSWDCSECPYKNAQHQLPTEYIVQDFGAYELPAEIYRRYVG